MVLKSESYVHRNPNTHKTWKQTKNGNGSTYLAQNPSGLLSI